MRYFYPLIIFSVTLLSCSSKNQNTLLAPFKADVLYMNPMSAHQDASMPPSYTFEPHIFQFLTDFDELDGRYFKLYRGGKIEETEQLEFIGSPNPKLNYKITHNVAVPKDYSTMAMLSAYYQFDTIAGQVQDITGISMQSIFDVYGKIEIFFEPKFIQESGSVIIDQYPKRNAAYMRSLHKFILYSRSNDEQVPLSMNLQVLAHEFGHSLWEFVFDHGYTEECNRLNAEYAIAGLNEGFADFFSYTLTGSANILQNSLNFKNVAQMRNFALTTFDYKRIADIADGNNSICNQSYYCTGVLFANALFKAQKNLGFDQSLLKGPKSRGEFFTAIVKALEKTRDYILYLPEPPEGFDFCALANNTDPFYNGLILGIFFNSFLDQIEDRSLKLELCSVLKENFGRVGFPPELRWVCL